LGFVIFLPALFYYFFVSPFIKKKIWRWFTAFLSLSYIVAFALLIRWQPAMGRYLMISVTLGAPLMAGLFFVSKPYIVLRWLAIATAIWILSWSVIYNFHKPLAGSRPIWEMDYYELRMIIKPHLAAGYRYLDDTVPETARLGIAGDGLALEWDYFFFGPRLERNVTYIDLPAGEVDATIFAKHNIDYLFLSEPGSIELKVPYWPLFIDSKTEWYLIKRDEAELFATTQDHSLAYQRAFGDAYQAYVEIQAALNQVPQPVRVLTTDPRMPFYDQDPRFVFSVTQDLEDLDKFTHLIIAPWWNTEDFQRLGLSSLDLQSFLAEEKFVKKLFEINGYELYQIVL
jgi:hypothetical protein